ncbi:hypothetical protein BHE74_00003240 [Ensete ventricosum]|nr:hypothetical protein BHE74_00003240 [Ensete ventricosum]
MIILLTKRCPSPLPSPSLRVVAPRRPCPSTPALPRGGRCCLYGRRRARGQHLYGRHPCGCSCELPPFQATASTCRCRPYERLPLVGSLCRRLAMAWLRAGRGRPLLQASQVAADNTLAGDLGRNRSPFCRWLGRGRPPCKGLAMASHPCR